MIRIQLTLIGAMALFLPGTRASAQAPTPQPSHKSENPLVTALSFSHRYAHPKALAPSNDNRMKAILIAALKEDSTRLSWHSVGELFDKGVFQKIADGGDQITLEKMERMLQEQLPPSRQDLFPRVRQHAALLTTQFDLIEEKHRAAGEELVAWIGKNYDPDKKLAVIVICTGNSRRSMLGATMGNIAASYYGLPKLRFYSGGTTPSAFNARAINALKEIGVEVEPSGLEAPRGSLGEENPIYRVCWGKLQETQEFSKLYSDSRNPQKDFAAILVCSEADAACPAVIGASKRIPVPYMDPKMYDGAPFEAAKYAERRDDMGRFMFNVLMQANRRLEIDGKLK
jgi:arsenate reductase